MNLETHINDLIIQADVLFYYDPDPFVAQYNYDDLGGRAATVTAPGATDADGYWTTLHELGHVHVHRSGRFGPQRRRVYDATCLAHEAAAWRWAIANSLLPLDDTARSMMRYCLGTYKHAAAKDFPGAIDDPLAQDFCALLEELR